MKNTVLKNLNINGKICDIVCDGGKIAYVGSTELSGIDFKGKRAFAGLIDIHTHGIGGVDTMNADFDEMAMLQAKNGTTTFYPTTMTASEERLKHVLNAKIPERGAKIPGFHLEGPYINPDRCGAQNAEFIRKTDINEFAGYDKAKIITVAPETENALEFIKNTNMLVCLGHTAADYETACAAARAGAKCLTHTFNAMPPLHHREPSVIGAAFDNDMYVQVICDGKHIHPSVIRILYKLFGADRMILISDSMRATLLSDGEYEFGGLPITVKGAVARTHDGALAGSTSTLLDCVKCAVDFGIDINDAFKMASQTPAKLMGLDCGAIKEGLDCDIVVINDDMSLDTVIINGEAIN